MSRLTGLGLDKGVAGCFEGKGLNRAGRDRIYWL